MSKITKRDYERVIRAWWQPLSEGWDHDTRVRAIHRRICIDRWLCIHAQELVGLEDIEIARRLKHDCHAHYAEISHLIPTITSAQYADIPSTRYTGPTVADQYAAWVASQQQS